MKRKIEQHKNKNVINILACLKLSIHHWADYSRVNCESQRSLAQTLWSQGAQPHSRLTGSSLAEMPLHHILG